MRAVGRKVEESKMDTAAAREKLKSRDKPYFRLLGDELHLGYRKSARKAVWLARQGARNPYKTQTFGVADRFVDGRWREEMTFAQAQRRAREIAEKPQTTPTGPLTVNIALDQYFEALEARGSKSLSDARGRAALHIRPKLGEKLVASLDRKIIADWLAKLAAAAPFVRGKEGVAVKTDRKASSEEERRQRKSSANRILTILKAALNHAYEEGDCHANDAWRRVRPLPEADAARVHYYCVEEARRLVNTTESDFRRLVRAALFTGARYGELCRLRVSDFNPDSGTVFVARSKAGKPRHVILTDEGRAFFEEITADRNGREQLLQRDGAAWKASEQIRPMIAACKAARIEQAGFHTLRHTYASLLVMSGVPLQVVAKNLGHADTRMCEKHYAHLSPSYMAETIRKFAPTLGTAESTDVIGEKM